MIFKLNKYIHIDWYFGGIENVSIIEHFIMFLVKFSNIKRINSRLSHLTPIV